MKKIITTGLAMMLVIFSFAGCSSNTTSQTSTLPSEEETSESSSAEAEGVSSDSDKADVNTATSYAEAPMLSEMVSAGTIPDVEERIPSSGDVMVENVESVGTYGGASLPIQKPDGTPENRLSKGCSALQRMEPLSQMWPKGLMLMKMRPFTPSIYEKE